MKLREELGNLLDEHNELAPEATEFGLRVRNYGKFLSGIEDLFKNWALEMVGEDSETIDSDIVKSLIRKRIEESH